MKPINFGIDFWAGLLFGMALGGLLVVIVLITQKMLLLGVLP